MRRNEINFVHEEVSPEDKELFLGPFDSDDGPLLLFNNTHTMAHLMHMAGCFPSVTQARKNGWNNPVPSGYQQISFGKTRLMVYILNKLPEEERDDMIDDAYLIDYVKLPEGFAVTETKVTEDKLSAGILAGQRMSVDVPPPANSNDAEGNKDGNDGERE